MIHRATRRQFITGLGCGRVAAAGPAAVGPGRQPGPQPARGVRSDGRPSRFAHRLCPWRRHEVRVLCRGEPLELEWSLEKGGLGQRQGLHRLAEDVRETRQGSGRGFRRHAGPQPFRPDHDRHLPWHPLLHGKAAHLVGAGSATPGRGLRQEPQGRHADGQPGTRRAGMADRLRVHQGRRDRRRAGVPHLDQPPHLAAGRRAPHPDRPRAAVVGLGRVDRPGADAALRRATGISPSCGADGSTSVPAPWATWPATRPTASMRS